MFFKRGVGVRVPLSAPGFPEVLPVARPAQSLTGADFCEGVVDEITLGPKTNSKKIRRKGDA